MDLIERAAHRLAERRQGDAPRITVEAAPSPSLAAAGAARSERVIINLARLAANGFITPEASGSQLGDEFRVIKRPLLAKAAGPAPGSVRNGNLIVVTSSVQGEGKSFVALNLAMSMAMELDRSVLLVDADVRRPSLPATLGLAGRRGLLDVLEDPAIELSQVLLRTNVDKLSLLLSGTQRPRSTELLASEAMAALLRDLATRYEDRIVLFDSPPLLATTESRVLAHGMGQIVFVVRAESTLKRDVQYGLAAIEACPNKMLVLNGVTQLSQAAYGSGYGPAYGYGP